MKLLIGYDGSESADAALEDLQWAGLPTQVEAVVLSAADVWLPPPIEEQEPEASSVVEWMRPGIERARVGALQAVEEAQRLAERAAARLCARFTDWKVDVSACADAPAWALLKRSWAWKPDLIVVGARGRSVLSCLLLGSVSRCVLAHADCSVRIGRARQETSGSALRLVVGLDGSAGAEAAVSAISGRTWPEGTTVCVVGALDPQPDPALSLPTPTTEAEPAGDDTPRVWLETLVTAVAEKLERQGLPATPLLTEGDPKQALLEQAEQWQADAIFVGARGLRGVERFLLGSVSSAIATHAPCSVEVVRVGPKA